MNTDLAKQIAEVIVSEAIIENWKFYVLVILLTGISSFFASYFGGYLSKKGQNLATKKDFNDLKAQLKETTETTEQIRNDIEHQVWRKQQIEALRRKKLEEFLMLIYVVHDQLSREMENKYLGTTYEVDAHASNKAIMIRRLYFPELATEHGVFLQAYSKFRSWTAEGVKELQERKVNGEQNPVISQGHMDKYAGHLKSLNDGINLIESKAEQIAKEWNIA
jgi:hypothetical protein